MTPAELLDFEFHSNDLGETLTVRAYFTRLLTTLWEEGEGFSGKRPFGGSSGWQMDIEHALVRAGRVECGPDGGEADEDLDPLILAAIRLMGGSDG